MKRIKHITINLNEDQYKELKYLADKERRKIADIAYLLLTDSLEEKILKAVNIKSGKLEKISLY